MSESAASSTVDDAVSSRVGKASGLPPGPSPGILGWPGSAMRYFRDPIAYQTALKKNYGNVVRLIDRDHPTIFTRPTEGKARTVFGFGPECNKEIFSRPDVFHTRRPRGPEIPAFERISESILFMNSDLHRQRRRLLNPAFTRERLKVYHNDIIRYTEEVAATWQDGQQVDLAHELNVLTRSIASKALLGLDPTGESGVLSRLMAAIPEALFSPVTLIPIDLPGTPYRRLRETIERVESMLLAEIERKREANEQGEDILSRLIHLHDEEEGVTLSDAELISQTFVIYFAGHETSTSALCSTLFLLAQHPEVMAELADELERELGGEPPTYQQIYELPVLDRVVKEVLRVLGPSVGFARVAMEHTSLAGFEIPKGTELLYSSYITHHDAEIYDEPYRFRPDRWLDIKPSLFEYIPFGGGTRRCLGASFGGMLLRTVIATLVQRWRFQAVHGAKVDYNVNVVMGPNQMPMIVQPLDGEFHKSPAGVEGRIRQMVALD